jgi:DNA replication and repair protein RecF
VFHVEHGFVDQWQRYQKALKQRNAALRAGAPRSVICAWDPELVRLGEAIQAARLRYLETLQPIAIEIARKLLGLELELSLRAGWGREESLAQALADSAAKEQESGGTQVGPHRAELAIRLNGSPVKDRISRGQQKLLAAALLMAQLRCFPVQNEARPTLLLDDPAAELDSERLLELIQEVGRHSVQLVVTSLQNDFQGFGSPGRRYSVEAGRLIEL